MVEIKALKIIKVQDKHRLAAKIKIINKEFELYYEVENEYGAYLCDNYTDPFILILLRYAMHMNYDIKCETPVSTQLYYQLVNYYIPILSSNISCYYSKINIICSMSEHETENQAAVGTGMSGGVDSFYTVIKHLNCIEPSFRLSHLLFANVGALSHKQDYSEKIYVDKLMYFKEIANDLSLYMVGVNTNVLALWNLLELNNNELKAPDSLKTCSCVFALRKLFSKFYFSSSFTLDMFNLAPYNTPMYDLFNLQSISLNSFMFYSTGMEARRIQKIKYISSNDIVRNKLCVCYDINCNVCFKCLRTMCELYVINELANFKNVFDVDAFLKRKVIIFSKVFGRKEEWTEKFCEGIISEAKRNCIRIPIISFIIGFVFYKPLYFFKSKFKNNKLMRKIYYKSNIDVLFNGENAYKLRDTNIK